MTRPADAASDSSGDGSDTAGPEHEAKHELTEWLTGHGATVWWEEANEWGHQQFTLNRRADTGGTPDLVVEIDDTVLVIEFKRADRVAGVYDALFQLHDYWLEHVTREQRFKLGRRIVEPDGFLTATKNSRVGRLFPAYAEQEPDGIDERGKNRRVCTRLGQLPPAEFRMTEQHIRSLWRLGKRSQREFDADVDAPHLGALLSTHLERRQVNPNPAVLWDRGQSNQDWTVFGDE